MDIFEEHCARQLYLQRCEMTMRSLRETAEFPIRILSDSTFFVDTWGEADSWFYATHGTATLFTPGTSVQYTELESTTPKFLGELKPLGLSTCEREGRGLKVNVRARCQTMVKTRLRAHRRANHRLCTSMSISSNFHVLASCVHWTMAW